MYSIGNLIYGYDLSETFTKELERLEADMSSDWYEGENGLVYDCIQLPYSGAGDAPGWVGVELGEIDPSESVDVPKLLGGHPSRLDLEDRVDALKAKLPDSLKELLGVRTMWIVWSTS